MAAAIATNSAQYCTGAVCSHVELRAYELLACEIFANTFHRRQGGARVTRITRVTRGKGLGQDV
eukprot:642538-Pelagomonas_calceolata.AAC.1